MLSVLQADDQLMHLQWKDRGTGTVEVSLPSFSSWMSSSKQTKSNQDCNLKCHSQDDLIIFPDDVEFKAVPACTTGRVFVLKFKTSNKRMFFWMQVCMFCVTHLGHSHILLRRSQRLTRMRSCARRYALHRRSVTSLLRIEKFEERIFILPAYSCCR